MIKRIFVFALFFISPGIFSFAQVDHLAFTSQPQIVALWKDSVQIKWSTNLTSLAVINTEREKPDISWHEFKEGFDGAFIQDHLFTVRGLLPGHVYNLNICSYHLHDTTWSQTKVFTTPLSSNVGSPVSSVVVSKNYFTAQPHAVAIWKDSLKISWSTNMPSIGIVVFEEGEPMFSISDLDEHADFKIISEHSLIIRALQPGKVYSLSVLALSEDDNDSVWSEKKYFATQSSSTGKFTIYFTASVDTLVSTGVNATFLNNVVDDTLVEYINRSQHTLDIAIYNTTSSMSVADIALAINNAYARGVRVRIIYDGSTGNTMIPNVNPLINRVASPQGNPFNIMHNKFVLIDADASNPNLPIVWTGSTNWTTSQINGTDKNNVIIVQDQSLAQAFKIEFNEMWGDTSIVPNPGFARFGPNKLDNTPHLFNIGGTIVESYFSPSDSVNTHLMNTIGTANTDMEFASMVITRNEIADSIVARVNAGVFQTYGLTDDSVLTTTWGILKTGMLPHTMASHTGQSGIMHNKYLIVDQANTSSDPLVWTGSHNWSASANNQNDENSLVIHDATVANIYYQSFVSLFNTNGGIMSIESSFTDENWINVYPNPSNENVNVRVNVKGEMKIYNLLGEEVGSEHSGWKLEVGENKIDVRYLSKGIYILRFFSGNKTSIKKLIIR